MNKEHKFCIKEKYNSSTWRQFIVTYNDKLWCEFNIIASASEDAVQQGLAECFLRMIEWKQ